MFNGMMDPELFRIAQEQISRMSPAELARIQQQMMSNPEVMRMASESMKNMRPEDLRHAAEQLKHTRPEEMAEIGEKMANASPEEIAAMRSRADAQMSYELNAAEMLKKQGNDLHSQGSFGDALQKYLLAKQNLKGILSSKGRTLSLACSLNLMSCYLKTRQYDRCIEEGSEVLASDTKNVKALYRRGQAYKEIGQLEAAVQDLSKALEVSPDDETIAAVLRDAKERLAREGSHQAPGKLIIEEITEEEEESVSSGNHESSSRQYSVKQPQESMGFSKNKSRTNGGDLKTNLEGLEALRDDPEAIRSFQNFISNADPDTLAAMGGGKAGEVSPNMFKAASNMISKMSSDDLQKMLKMASSFQGENPYKGALENGFGPGSVPSNVTPDMIKNATDMMGKMPPEELQKMFEMASTLKGKDSIPAAVHNSRQNSEANSRVSEPWKDSASNRNYDVGETSSGVLPNSMSASQSNLPVPTADLQEQMRNQMNDPAMRQMFTSMMKNMSPDMMANMSEQFGLKLSREDAARAQEVMSSLSPEDLDRMMRWADRIQTGVNRAQKAKNWLLGKPGVEETNKSEAHLTSAAAFVEGGIQEACDDACSICLEVFCESDPSTVTGCKHEFHLQCILEWCQRSSQCPMCWQPISLKDPTSQELLEAVERERSIRFNPSRNSTIFRHPTLGDFELQHLPLGANDHDLEERIIQHLAAAAAMGRAHHIARRESQRNRSSAQGRPQFLVFSTHSNAPSTGPGPSSPTRGEGAPAPAIIIGTPPSPPTTVGEESSELMTQMPSIRADQISASGSGSSTPSANQHGHSLNNTRSPNQSSPSSQDRAGPSDFQSFSESLKSRLNAVSTRYKESISRSTRGWKERFFSRNTSMSDLGSEVRREVNAGIATVSRMMERLETRDNTPTTASVETRDNTPTTASVSNSSEGSSVSNSNNQRMSDASGDNPVSGTNIQASFAASSGSN